MLFLLLQSCPFRSFDSYHFREHRELVQFYHCGIYRYLLVHDGFVAQFSLNNVHKIGLKHHHFMTASWSPHISTIVVTNPSPVFWNDFVFFLLCLSSRMMTLVQSRETLVREMLVEPRETLVREMLVVDCETSLNLPHTFPPSNIKLLNICN